MDKTLYPKRPVLLVDDEPSWLRAVSMLLERQLGINHQVTCSDSREATRLFEEQSYSMLLLDLTMPHRSGEEVLMEAREKFPEMPVIILTGRNEVELAVNCMKLGAYDYFIKTVEDERLLHAVGHALEISELRQENLSLQQGMLADDLRYPEAFDEFVTNDQGMIGVFRYAEAVSESRQPVLISGETGTGKELMARAFHKLSAAGGPFVAVNIAGLDDHVFSDTLFGHVRGAFTGADQNRSGLVEEAAGGVLFLDEIGDLEASSQVKLLRLLQEGEYFPLGGDRPRRCRARIVVATNIDLAAQIETGGFRRDLFYRLNTHHVRLPALRQRQGDLALLLNHFAAQACREMGKSIPVIDNSVVGQLEGYTFPGNLRELRSLVFDAVSRMQGGRLVLAIEASAMLPAVTPEPSQRADNATMVFPASLPTLHDAAELLIEEAMSRAQGNITQAAKWLGISRPALSKRLKHKG